MEFISDGCLKLTGYKPEDFLNNNTLSFKDIILPRYHDYLWHEWQKKLITFALEKLSPISGIKIIGSPKERGPIISFVLEGVHPLDLGTLLGLKGIAVRTGHLCAYPTLQRLGVNSLARLSFGIYNTIEEIDTTVHAIKEGAVILNPINAT